MKKEFTLDDFKKDLAKLINCYSRENLSNTPDYILAEYINDCLNAYEKATQLNSSLKKPKINRIF